MHSPNTAISPPETLRTHQTTWALLALVFLNYIANFSHYAEFGLYEDDYILTLPIFNWSRDVLWQQLSEAITTWPHGRPLMYVAHYILTFALSRLDSLPFLYVTVFLSTSLCLLAIYLFLRAFLSEAASFIATALFCLYPIANGKAIFMHQIYFYWTPILVLLLFTQYLQRRYVLFFLGSFLVLLTYEPYFLVLPFAPLLVNSQSWRERLRGLFVTSSVLAGILVIILLIRHQLGDSRTVALLEAPLEIGRRVITAPWIGFITTLKASIVFPLDALKHGNAALFIEGLIAFLITYGMSMALYHRAEGTRSEPKMQSRSGSLIIAGAAMFFAPYFYRFIPDYYPPIVDIGRLSMLHFPSAIGAALFIGASSDLVLHRLPKLKTVTLICCSAYLALLAVFANHLQLSEYARYWRMQQNFVRNVIEQTRDLGDGDIAIVDIETGFGDGVDARPTTPGFPPFWMVNYTSEFLKTLNHYPTAWQRPPKLFGFWKDVPTTIQDDTVFLATPPWQPAEYQARVRDGKFAWLEWVEGRLIRRQKPVTIAGVTLTPKPLDEKAPIPPSTKLALMFFNMNDASWPSMQKARNYPQ